MHAAGRLVVEGWSPRDLAQAQRLLTDGLRALPRPVEYLVGPGGFVTLYAPVADFESGWGSSERLPESFEKLAKACAAELSDSVPDVARRKAHYFTFGLDIRDDSPAVEKHAELVVVVDLRTSKMVLLTGKTYPTADQARTLIRAADWRSHLWTPPNGDRVIVLGCHDFNIYSNRALSEAGKKKDGERYKEILKARKLFKAFKPTHVLHHPHGTDIASTWRVAYSGVKELHPKLEQAVSGIGHPRFKSRENDDVEVVLAATQTPACASVDVVVRGNAGPSKRQADAIPRSLDTAVSAEEQARDDAEAKALYEQGMEQWRYFERHGVPMKKGARTTKPAPPPKPHKGIKATAKNSCFEVRVNPTGPCPPNAIVLYHGAQRWTGEPEVVAHRKGHAEHGPGIYLTTSWETANKYGSVYRIKLDPKTRWLEDVQIPSYEVFEFVRLLRRFNGSRDILQSAGRFSRIGPDRIARIKAEYLVNIFVNADAASGQRGPALARFLVEHGADASRVRNSMDDWVVVFNPKIICAVEKLTPKDVRAPGFAFDLPRVGAR